MRDFFRDVDVDPAGTGVRIQALSTRAIRIFETRFAGQTILVTDDPVHERRIRQLLAAEGLVVYQAPVPNHHRS